MGTEGCMAVVFLWQARVTNFYISDRNSGKRFYVRAGESALITPMIKQKTISFDGDKKGASQNLKRLLATNELSCNGDLTVKEGYDLSHKFRSRNWKHGIPCKLY